MKLKFRNQHALVTVVKGLISEEIPYKVDYLVDNTGTYEETDYTLEIDDSEFIEEGKINE